MKNYLYDHWAESTLVIAITVSIMLMSFINCMTWYLFLVWMQFPFYLVHEFEEHVYPGKFKTFFNQIILDSNRIDFPLSTANVFWINILAIWFLFPIVALLTQHISPIYGVLLPMVSILNASLHIIFAIVKRKYNPGLLTSIFLLYPTSIYTFYILYQSHLLQWANTVYSFLFAFLAHALIVVLVLRKYLRYR